MNKSGKNMKNQHQQVEALIQQSDPKLRPWAITEAAKFFAKIQNDPQIIPELLQALNDTYTKLYNQRNEPAKPRNQHQHRLSRKRPNFSQTFKMIFKASLNYLKQLIIHTQSFTPQLT
jgi:hypothetical protein